MTFREYIENNKLVPGTVIELGAPGDSETIIIGNSTPYIEPTNNDGGIGWDYDHPRMDKIISAIRCLT